LVAQVFKDPYTFDFIFLGREAKERDLEDALTSQLQKFLLELGQFFSFMGRQYRIDLGENEYFFDLLFYHTRLKRYIIIELLCVAQHKRSYVVWAIRCYLNTSSLIFKTLPQFDAT
jgi:predicted nuclease of restriction endonuclease-like (RecB) superfamily